MWDVSVYMPTWQEKQIQINVCKLKSCQKENQTPGMSTLRMHYPLDVARKKWYFKSMNRKHTTIYKMADRRNDDFVPGTPIDRINLVWTLTQEIASLSGKYDVERRLQRHVTHLVRREG